MINGRYQAFIIGTLSLAFFSLSHNISLLLFTPFLFIYLFIIGWQQRLEWAILLSRLLLFFVLGLGMTLFYSGGALLELGNVTLEQSTTTRNNDFHYNFVTVGEIFGPVAPEDPNLVNPDLLFRLGWLPVGLAVLAVFGAVFWFFRKNSQLKSQNRKRVLSKGEVLKMGERWWHIWFMVGATAVFLFMALPSSLWVWENLPLIDFVQFPWRFVGRAALPVAFLAVCLLPI